MNEISSSKLTQAVIGIIVAVIVLGIVLVPVLNQVTETEKDFTNEGYFRMSEINSEDTDTYVVSWDVTTPNTITVNDEPIQLNLSDAPSEVSVIFNGDWGCRANITNGEITSITYLPNNGVGGNATSTMVCTLSGGNMSVVIDSTTTKTDDYSVVYLPDAAGAFTMKKSTESAYVMEGSKLVGFGLSNIRYAPSGFGQRGITFSGSIADGVTSVIWRPPSDTTTTLTDVTINATKDVKYNGLYVLTNITMVSNHTNEGQTAQTDLTYSYFLVPYEVTAELSNHPTSMMITLINVIPVFIVLAIILGVCGLFYYRRNENSLI